MTRTISIFSAAVLSLSLFGTGIDNAPLLPKWVGDSEVKLECLSEDATASPDWVKSLIIVEANVATASTDGTLAGMSRVLDHLAETGVNGLWLTPVNERPHYGNFGIHTLNSALTGTGDIPEQWRRVRAFVQEAHRRNIRVFFDVVSWGVTKDAPLYREKPEWFKGDRSGRFPLRQFSRIRRLRPLPGSAETSARLRPQSDLPLGASERTPGCFRFRPALNHV